ncbi:MAG TPA: SMP-30/gluconolactonase/LRE family protein [Casimicrobiaceae bacterium]|nr:SMP-30/gluconolactonase/LRE family protein [Casimicrobiaceae bacterium]
MPPDATLLSPVDDVATALRDLPAGARVRAACGSVVRDVTLLERIPLGHKLAVRTLGAGLRIRKYGEPIGRLTADVAAGAWIHDHNLASNATRDPSHERAWCTPVAPAVRALGEARTTVGETPVFDAQANRLYWIDVRETPAIHALDLGSGREAHWPLREDIGSIAPAPGGRLVAGLRSGFAFFDPSDGTLSPILDPEADRPANRMNDGKCDPSGRFWCTSMNPESGTADGSLYVLDGALRCRRLHGGYFTPNGLAWSPDGRTMYCSDTRRGLIEAFTFDATSGALGERRVFADVSALPGGPDGATVDADGYLWSAQFDGGCLIRYDPHGGIDRVVRLPVTKPASCAFGGPGYRDLFVTTAMRGLSESQRRAEPLAGRVLVLDVGVAGLPPVAFAVEHDAARAEGVR